MRLLYTKKERERSLRTGLEHRTVTISPCNTGKVESVYKEGHVELLSFCPGSSSQPVYEDFGV